MASAVSGSLRRASHLWRWIQQPSAASAIVPAFRQMSTSEPIVNKRLEGKVAIITGASGSIGAVAAKLFAAHGAKVIVADIADEGGQEVVSQIGDNAVYRHCDATKEQDVASTVDFAVEKFGKLDIMFNNAGVVTPLDNFQDLDLEAYDKYTSVMVRGVVAGIKHASRVMIPAKSGAILTTASTASVWTGGSAPLVYNINKSSLPGLTKIAAYHLGKHGIRVNAISPHAIPTPLVIAWLQKLGWDRTHEEITQAYVDQSSLYGKRCTEEDIANGALFLCSDEAGYVSGQNLMVDGGWVNSKEFNLFGNTTPEKT